MYKIKDDEPITLTAGQLRRLNAFTKPNGIQSVLPELFEKEETPKKGEIWEGYYNEVYLIAEIGDQLFAIILPYGTSKSLDACKKLLVAHPGMNRKDDSVVIWIEPPIPF